MTVEPYALVTGALPTSGNQSYTKTGFGTPKAAIVFFSGGVVADTVRAHAQLGVGFLDDTNQACGAMTGQDAAATSNTNRSHSNAHVVMAPDPTLDAATELQLTGSLITDGVQLTVVNAPAAAYQVAILLIGGPHVKNADVVFLDDLGASSGAVTVSMNKSFKPNHIFACTVMSGTVAPMSAGYGAISFGTSDLKGNDRATMFGLDDAVANNAFLTSYLAKGNCIGQAALDDVPWLGSGENAQVGSFDINLTAATGNDIGFFLAIEYDGTVGLNIHDAAVRASSNSWVATQKRGTCTIASFMEGISAYNTKTTNAPGCASIVAFDQSSTATLSCIMDDDNAASSPNKSLFSNSLSAQLANNSGLAYAGTARFSRNGYKFDTTTRPGSDILGWGCTVGIKRLEQIQTIGSGVILSRE